MVSELDTDAVIVFTLCDRCGTRVDHDLAVEGIPVLPAGWRSDDSGDYCPDCHHA